MAVNEPMDALTDEERLEQERRLREQGIKPHELTPEEKEELLMDIDKEVGDDDERLSDVVPDDENDGND